MTPEQEQRRLEARRLHQQEHLPFAEIARRIGVSAQTARKYCRGLGIPDNLTSRLARGESRQNPTNNEAMQAELREKVFQMRLEGMTVTAVARATNRRAETVRLWIDHEIESRVGPKVEKLRELAIARLDALSREAWAVLHAAAPGTEMRLKALDRLIQIERRRAATEGTDSPVRVDAVMTERTQADMELEEMLRELDARNTVIQGQIQGAVVDEPADPAT